MKPEPMHLSALTVSHEPPSHEPWCDDTIFGDYNYVACTCDFAERHAKWRSENRDLNAAKLPIAVARRRSK